MQIWKKIMNPQLAPIVLDVLIWQLISKITYCGLENGK